MRKIYTLLLFQIFAISLMAQVPGDDCNSAIFLPDVNDYCSEIGEFSLAGTTLSATPAASCWGLPPSEDVWFAFRATRTTVSIRIIGATNIFTGGTFSASNKSLVLYSDDCGNLTEIACTNKGDDDVITINSNVNVGDIYFFRLSAQFSNSGTFQICINNIDPVPDPVSDCEPGVLLCDKSSFIVPFLRGNGAVTNEIVSDGMPCGNPDECGYEELQSGWYKWICDQPGSLTFDLTPLNPVDDLDFWVYELPNGVDDCTDKMPLLCMASGAIRNAPTADWIRCHGPTGLRTGEQDENENCGCDGPDNNYIRPLQMEAGKAYALVVMNFSQTDDGFRVDFGGTGTFVGPDVDFTIDPELDNQCDIDQITFTNNSTSGIGAITNFDWNFGAGADIRTSDQEGPHNITYQSFGEKNIVLRITTEAGCATTLIRSLFIEPCCDPANDLVLDLLDSRDPQCPGIPSGFFTIGGNGGSPDYSFSSDGVDFNPITQFNGLAPGTYDVWIQDIKGCRDSIEVVIDPAPPFEVDAGADQVVDLGYDTQLNGDIIGNPPYTFMWDSIGGMSCFDCLDPTVIPFGTTSYVLNGMNTAGCSSSDTVTVRVNVSRPFYIPSAFSPNNDGINDFFTGYAGRQVSEIEKMLIFDRWGELIYKKENFLPNEETLGWDGTFRNELMNSGVFAYYMKVLYIDNISVEYEGDVTLLR